MSGFEFDEFEIPPLMEFINQYSVLLSSFAGVMICDYYLVRKGVSCFFLVVVAINH